MTYITRSLWLLIYEGLIINLALVHLSFMPLYIFLALLGPLIFGWVSLHKEGKPPTWVKIGSVIYLLVSLSAAFIVPSILL